MRIIIKNADSNDFNELAKLAREGKIHTFCMTDDYDWIPCEERLPHAEYGESDSVLCQLENDTMKVLYWNGGNWHHPTGELYHSVNHKNGWHNRVVAWMPLPTPYMKEGDQE